MTQKVIVAVNHRVQKFQPRNWNLNRSTIILNASFTGVPNSVESIVSHQNPVSPPENALDLQVSDDSTESVSLSLSVPPPPPPPLPQPPCGSCVP